MSHSQLTQPENLALVLTGGGARAAYQVGFLRFLATRFPNLDIPILTGVSAGAINAAHLAAHQGTFQESVEDLVALWQSITPEIIFRTDGWSLFKSLVRWSGRLVSGGAHTTPTPRGFVDTDPLARLLLEKLPNKDGLLTGLQEKIAAGRLKAVGITTTDYGTGQSVTWIEGRDVTPWVRPHRRSGFSTLSTRHVLASAALPLLFPAVRLDHSWHGDGGIRLTAPLAPAMHMGAQRIVAVSNRYHRSQDEAEQSVIHGYPPPAQVIGTLMNAMFLDMLDFDAANMERFNQLLEYVPLGQRGDLRRVDTAILRPSQDLGRLAAKIEPKLPRSVRFFTRGFGTRETEAPDSLSLLMFQPEYVSKLIALGEKDAQARADELTAFVDRA
jgi:NTE family protein